MKYCNCPTQIPPNIFDDLMLTVTTSRALMLRIAQLQLNSTIDAEDVVQDAILAALKGWQSFNGNSSIKTWLLAILRYKIIDKINAKVTELVTFSSGTLTNYESEDDNVSMGQSPLFSSTYESEVCPIRHLERKQLFEIVELCLISLPEESARIFLMREYLGLKIAEIAIMLGVSEPNVRVKLHRSRVTLRECASKRWGGHFY
ncbi:sigma-70 family RNA polymerase sigma factor [Undibacterium crateris]|uniref:sigma-70 family RNA polymerase sigma factor n=1 Tax=Undibacterium crateris TaxID=2528175 RepID=UPI001F178A86|nr:sigma-70 family RNA polymerase sigma factor [Undibacterium crateris]